MSLKRVLGTMLASRMAGRGRRRGLGTAAMMGGLGYPRRRSGLGGKLGVAALGYMAYRAYQDSQSRTSQSGSGTSGHSGTAGTTGGIGDMIRDVTNRLTGNPSGSQTASAATPHSAPPEMQDGERAAETIDDATALLLIRAMVTAAYSDGALSQDERARIMDEIESAGADDTDRRTMEREIANPRPLDELLVQVRDADTAQEFYLASRAAVDGETDSNRAYLADLRRRLDLTDEDVAEVEEMAAT